MSDNKKYYYLKLRDNFFDNDDVAILESMPDGILYSNILLKLYLRSLKNNGKLMFNDRIPYNAQMLSTVTRQPVAVVEKAVGIFKEMGLIEVLDNGAIYMLDIQNFIGSSNTEADRKREYRRKIALEKDQKFLGHLSGQMSDEQAPEKEIEIENRDIKEIDSAKDNSPAAIAEYYQSRIGVLDGKQFEQLLDYIRFDHMEYELVKLAIDKAADNSTAENTKRSFGYINGILKNWAQNGIKTTVQQEAEQSNFNKSKGFTTSRGNQSEQGAKDEWGF
jgi:phage replisome organizer N-terminal domain protein|uniref:DnaD like replication protein n=1 Tax=Siphoviridae sp. ctfZQ2 TaxID=2826415 RepID=A0A8S5NAV8_9CAUD|nr:MAG TPA: DnaD like replication protein [Siphoviridae sp. ctfZQ2]